MPWMIDSTTRVHSPRPQAISFHPTSLRTGTVFIGMGRSGAGERFLAASSEWDCGMTFEGILSHDDDGDDDGIIGTDCTALSFGDGIVACILYGSRHCFLLTPFQGSHWHLFIGPSLGI
jgi:hypothetical protein